MVCHLAESSRYSKARGDTCAGCAGDVWEAAAVCWGMKGESAALLSLCSGGNSPIAAGCCGLEVWFSCVLEPKEPRTRVKLFTFYSCVYFSFRYIFQEPLRTPGL